MRTARWGFSAGRGPLRSSAMFLLVLALVAAAAAAGCGRGQKDKGPAGAAGGAPAGTSSPGVAAGADSAGVAGPGVPWSGADLSEAAPGSGNLYRSAEGRFAVMWPLGCTLIHTRVYPRGVTGASIQYLAAGCNLYGKEGQGASVTVYFKQGPAGGGLADPSAVTDKIAEMTRKLKLQIVEQHPLAGGPYEGVRVFCHEVGTKNVVWIQGVLRGDRAYILSAWKPEGGSMTDAAIVGFFQSLRLDV